MRKVAINNSTWALLTEGVTSAQVGFHQIRQLLDRAVRLADDPEVKEAVHQRAGDILAILPERLDVLEADLERTAVVLVKVGDDLLSQGLALEDKARINNALEPAQKVAARWLAKCKR